MGDGQLEPEMSVSYTTWIMEEEEEGTFTLTKKAFLDCSLPPAVCLMHVPPTTSNTLATKMSISVCVNTVL